MNEATNQAALKSFDTILQEISDPDQIISAGTLYRLSDLNADDLKQIQSVWGAIPVERRRILIGRLSEITETNFEMEYGAITRLALTDLDNEVRQLAIDAAWNDESPDMATRLIAMASGDIAAEVRAAAASALGRFILLGELGKFDPGLTRRAQNIALKLFNDEAEDLEVRRRALEAVSNCTRDGISEMIEDAYQADDPRFRVSAVFAMGRSCDPKKWASTVLHELVSDDPALRYEAARAAGELELKQAINTLSDIVLEEDREVMEMAVWALGEIGGDEARNLLEEVMERADEQGDEALADAVEEALEAASLIGENIKL
ncbi:MAG: HEAT repeat domain-containing protein [Chloroflexota bacterium]